MLKHHSITGLLLGPVLFTLVLLMPLPDGMSPQGLSVAAVAVLMAVWWVTEAIPIPATALLPIVLFPVLGVLSGAEVTRAYGNHLIYLFLGGFLIAVTMERWNLHHRIALHTIRLVGLTPQRIVLGFMLATAFLSMWISNTATTMMMVTIAMAVLKEMQLVGKPSTGKFDFGAVLMLGIAYAASLGGVATLIGTPPNAIFAGVVEKTYGISIGFLDWMVFALPMSVAMLFLCWLYLTRVVFTRADMHLPASETVILEQIEGLGAMSRQEKQVAAVFCSVAVLWVLRGLYQPESLAMVKDSTIAIAGALLLFLIPVDISRGEFLLDWKTAVRVPWDIIILFGGGFALAQGFGESGLTLWLADQLSILQGGSMIIIILAVVLLVVFLTELTSNTATASLLLPVMGALAAAIDMNPLGLMVAAVVAASFAFMLPVATPPNAIVFSSRQVSITQMASAGFWLNLIGVVVITGFVYLMLPLAWGITLSQ